MPTRLTVNQRVRDVEAAPDTPLLYVLAGELELQGPRFGCGLAQCGIAVGTHLSSYAAAVADIEVDTQTGLISAKRIYGALEAGQAINPGFIENQISGMLVQAVSRVLKEEVTFSRTNVTSLDWVSYPVLRCGESPEVTAIVVKRQDQPSTGAGEEVLGPAAAAIANAFFDATGARLREHPMTPVRVLAAIRRNRSAN